MARTITPSPSFLSTSLPSSLPSSQSTSQPMASPPSARRGRRAGRATRGAAAVITGLSLAALLAACDRPVATYTVNTVVDGADAAPGDGACATAAGTCSLRAAIQEGNAVATVGTVALQVPAGTYMLTVAGAGEDGAATGDLDLTRRFSIVGTGTARVVQATSDRVLDVLGGGLQLKGVSLEQGDVAGDGGGIRAQAGPVSLEQVQLLSNRASGTGGGIDAPTVAVTITGSALRDNGAPAAAAVRAADVVLRRVTVAENIVEPGGSGSVVVSTSPTGAPVVESTTVSDNLVGATAVVSLAGNASVRDTTLTANSALVGLASLGTTTIGNSILQGKGTSASCTGTVVSAGTNIESGVACGFTAAGDLQSSPAGLQKAITIGIHTVYTPGPGPALDTGAGCAAADQTGAARPLDGNGDGVALCDRGATESGTLTLNLRVDTTADVVDPNPGDGACGGEPGTCSVRAAVMETNAWPAADTVRLPGDAIHTLTLAGAGEDGAATGDLDVTDDLAIDVDADGLSLATIDAGDLDRVLDLHPAVGGAPITVTARRIVARNGSETAGAGGAGIRVRAGATFTLLESTLRGNVASVAGGGGGGLLVEGTASVIASTINANRGIGSGGAIEVAGSVSVVNSTLTSNSANTGSAVRVRPGGAATIADSTLATNTSGPALAGGSSVTLHNTIVGVHTSGGCVEPVTSLGANLDAGTTCGLVGPGDLTSTDPLLGNLQDNGGPTHTRHPQGTSAAIDSGVCLSGTDQRGFSRPSGGACDRGAVEQV